jgi:hypothetical protein
VKQEQLFVYQGRKVHLFRPSLGFRVEAQPRFETGEDKRDFLAEMHIPTFFRRPHELQSKKHHRKNYKFILYLHFFQINTFINTYKRLLF